MAQLSPMMRSLRKLIRAIHENGCSALASAKSLASLGIAASSRFHPASPSFKPKRSTACCVAATPALVRPLLNRSTQIQPPSKR